MRIELEKRDPVDNTDLIKDMSADQDELELYPGGAWIDYSPVEIYESFAAPEALALIVSFTGQAISGLGINIFSNWLWGKLTKHKVRKIEIEGLDVRLNDKGKFQRILADKITIEI